MIRKGIISRFTLGKQERLKSRKLITELFGDGKAVNAFPLKALFKFSNGTSSPLQAGFTVSSRNFKRAVDRNRIKRLMREAYRIQKTELLEKLTSQNKQVIVFFIYTGKDIFDMATANEKVAAILAVISKEVNRQ